MPNLITSPSILLANGKAVVSSLDVAMHFGKQHKDVLRVIQGLISDCPADFTERNFALSDYLDSTGRTLPMYTLTRDAFTLLAMGFTGEKALKWKLKYIDAFSAMEQELTKLSYASALPLPELTEHNRRILDYVPGVTKRAVVKELAALARHNPKRATSLEDDILRTLWVLAPSQQRIGEYRFDENALAALFWESCEALASSGTLINHSRAPYELALNLEEILELMLDEQMYQAHATLTRSGVDELGAALQKSLRYPFEAQDKSVNSVITGKKANCWLFCDPQQRIRSLENSGRKALTKA